MKVRRYDYAPIHAVYTGGGAARNIAGIMDELGMTRALVVTTSSLVGSEALEQLLSDAGPRVAETFSGSVQHVPEEMQDALLSVVRAIQPDGVVTLGGGTVTDAGKAAALGMATDSGSAREMYDYRVRFTYPATVELEPVSGPFIPQIAIPTTLSAAEYDGVFGATLDGVKHLYLDLGLTPDVVVLDPEVTRGTPRWLWASTGIRTLDHAVETFLSNDPTAITDACAIDAARIVFDRLQESLDPQNMEARLDCLVAGWMSMIGVHNVLLGLSHGIGHQLGARCGVPHGQTSCIMLPVVLQRLEQVIPERMAEFAHRVGLVTDGSDVGETAHGLTASVKEFIASLDVPTRLTDVNVTRDDFAHLARDAMNDMVVAFSPIDVTESDIVEILEEAL